GDFPSGSNDKNSRVARSLLIIKANEARTRDGGVRDGDGKLSFIRLRGKSETWLVDPNLRRPRLKFSGNRHEVRRPSGAAGGEKPIDGGRFSLKGRGAGQGGQRGGRLQSGIGHS